MWRFFLPTYHSCPRNWAQGIDPQARRPAIIRIKVRAGCPEPCWFGCARPAALMVDAPRMEVWGGIEPMEPKSARAGARLFAELNLQNADQFEIIPVECLSVCKRPCTVSFAAHGKWTYIYGDLPADTSAGTILTGAALYTQAADGLIPWKQRPDALKKGVVARIPALNLPKSFETPLRGSSG
eukprot:gene9488-9568_t